MACRCYFQVARLLRVAKECGFECQVNLYDGTVSGTRAAWSLRAGVAGMVVPRDHVGLQRLNDLDERIGFNKTIKRFLTVRLHSCTNPLTHCSSQTTLFYRTTWMRVQTTFSEDHHAASSQTAAPLEPSLWENLGQFHETLYTSSNSIAPYYAQDDEERIESNGSRRARRLQHGEEPGRESPVEGALHPGCDRPCEAVMVRSHDTWMLKH